MSDLAPAAPAAHAAADPPGDAPGWFAQSQKWRRLLVGVALLLLCLLATATLGRLAGGHDLRIRLPGDDKIVSGPDFGGKVIELELAGNGSQFGIGRLDELTHALVIDVAYLIVYSAVLAAAALVLMPLYRMRVLRRNGPRVVMWAAIGAGGCDLVENGLLWAGTHLGTLHGPDWVFVLAATFAIAKFMIVAVVLLLLVGAVGAGACTPGWLTADLIVESRTSDDVTRGVAPPPVPVRGRGICLSGGGVRAASLTLGSLQVLERRRAGAAPALAWGADAVRVTAVSGGSYMAGGWQVGRGVHASGDLSHLEPWEWRGSEASPEEIHLVDNLGYLASTWPRGHHDETGTPESVRVAREDDPVGDVLRSSASVYATLFVGFMVNLLVLVSAIVLAVVAATLALDAVVGIRGDCVISGEDPTTASCLDEPRFWAPPVFWLTAGALLTALWVLVGKVGRLRRPPLLNAMKGVTRGSLVIGVVLGLFLLAFPFLIEAVNRWEVPSVVAAAGSLAGYATSLGRTLMKHAASFAPKLAGILFLAFLGLTSAVLAVQVLRLHEETDHGVLTVAVAAAAVQLAAWAAGAELWSMNAFYRGKLRLAYAARRYRGRAVSFVNDGDAQGVRATPSEPHEDVRDVAEPSIQDLAGHTPLTICASAHATTRAIKTHYGIPAMGFTFTPEAASLHVPAGGRPFTARPADLEASYRGSGGSTSHRITTMFAVALAGAAVAPAMGRMQIGPTSALITFGNVRLGAWLPNPRYVRPTAHDEMAHLERIGLKRVSRWNAARGVRFPKVRLSYLFREFFGIHDPSDAYVYVSDGGHWENIGLVEQLRDKDLLPYEIVVVDADPGDQTRVGQLSKAIDLAKLECDVRILIELDGLRAYARSTGGQPYADRSVALGVMNRGQQWGLLWYSKPVLAEDTPTTLLAHREIDDQFPHTSTIDQFFDVSTYEAYRDLGRYNARLIADGREALRSALGPAWGPTAPADDDAPGAWAVREFVALLEEFADDEQLRAAVVAGAREALCVSDPPSA